MNCDIMNFCAHVLAGRQKTHHVSHVRPQDHLHDSEGRPAKVDCEDGPGFFSRRKRRQPGWKHEQS